jgi:hypothetical protein
MFKQLFIAGSRSPAVKHGVGTPFNTLSGANDAGLSARTSYHGREETSSPSTASSANADFIDGLRQLKDVSDLKAVLSITYCTVVL